MRYKNPTPNPLPASDEGAKMYLIKSETAVDLATPKYSFCLIANVINYDMMITTIERHESLR